MDIGTEIEPTAELKSKWKSESFTSTVKTNSMTPQFLQAYKDVAVKPIDLAAALSEAIVDWDITLGDEPFPPTTENLAKCPMPFLFHLVSEICEVWSGDETLPEKSQNGSGRKAK